MDERALRRTFLWLFLGFLCLTALVAISAVLGDNFGELELRIVASSSTVSGASICALACAAFRERERGRPLGTIGIVLACVAAAMLMLLIWSDGRNRTQGRLTAVIAIYAIATAHAQLLWLPRLAERHRWAQQAAVGAIGLLSLLLTLLIFEGADSEGMLRAAIVVGIVVALLTLAVPILWKIGAPGSETRADDARLVLHRSPDGGWVDAEGARYDVQRRDA